MTPLFFPAKTNVAREKSILLAHAWKFLSTLDFCCGVWWPTIVLTVELFRAFSLIFRFQRKYRAEIKCSKCYQTLTRAQTHTMATVAKTQIKKRYNYFKHGHTSGKHVTCWDRSSASRSKKTIEKLRRIVVEYFAYESMKLLTKLE